MKLIDQVTLICLGTSSGSDLVSPDTALWFDPKIQLQLPVNVVDTLMIVRQTFDIAQIQKAQTKAPFPVRARELQ